MIGDQSPLLPYVRSTSGTGQGSTATALSTSTTNPTAYRAQSRSPNIPYHLPLQGVSKAATAGPTVPRSGSSLLLRLAGLKISDNQSPAPQDRIFYSFNYFDNINKSINQRLGNPVSNVQVFHNLFGFEKTFFGGQASLGLRVPLNDITFDTKYTGFPKQSSALGDLSVFAKFILLQSEETGSLLSGGLNLNLPTGSSNFAGSRLFNAPNPFTIQPFLGYIVNRGDFFVQGFTAIDVPTDSNAVTLLTNDLGVGYYAYRSAAPDAFLSAIIPTIETHVNVPLTHVGYNVNDPAGIPTVVDLTFGTHVQFRSRSLLTVAYVNPVTGPRPFSGEFLLFYNYLFGGSRRRVPPTT